MKFSLLQVSSFVGDKVAAGGHQGYAALGGLYTQARPMVPHLYGDLDHQARQIPVSNQFTKGYNQNNVFIFIFLEMPYSSVNIGSLS